MFVLNAMLLFKTVLFFFPVFLCPHVILSVFVILIFRFRIRFAAIDFDQHICPVIN